MLIFQDFVDLPVGEQFERLVIPREDWKGINYVQRALERILPAFAEQGYEFVAAENLASICRDGRMGEYLEKKSASDAGGFQTVYPQHGGLYALGKDELFEPQRIALAVFVMACVEQWRRSLKDENDPAARKDFNKRHVVVWRAIRKLSGPALHYLPSLDQPVDRIHDDVEDARQGLDERKLADHGAQKNYLGYLRLFLESYLGWRKYEPRSKSKQIEKDSAEQWLLEKKIPVEKRDPDSEIISGASEIRQIEFRRSVEALRSSDHFKDGIAPEELSDSPSFHQAVTPVHTKRGGSLTQSVRTQVSRQMHRRRQAQLLPERWEVLNDDELRKLGILLLDDGRHFELTTILALSLMLLTGRELDEVLKARVGNNQCQLPERPPSSGVYVLAESGEWHTGIQKPDDRRLRKGQYKSALELHHQSITVPFPPVIWDRIKALVRKRASTAKQQCASLFRAAETASVRSEVKAIIAEINSRRRARLTQFRIAYQLTEELHQKGGDLIEACLITNREPPSGPSAALYYHHASRQKLVEHYVEVTTRWQTLWRPNEPVKNQQITLPIDGNVGSDLVIQERLVSQCFEGLREQARLDFVRQGQAEGLRSLHNAVTNYLVMMIFWMTGYRAVQDPIARASDFNLKRRILFITDKTGEGASHARMVPLCQVLADQLSIYQKHAANVRARLSVLDRARQPTFLFYLDKDLNEVQVRPRTISNYLWAYSLPLNFSRHWLRGSLRGQGVPGAYVNAFMGHWGIGQEPWGKHSSIDPLDYCDVVGSALDKLSQRLGLETITEVY